MNSELYHWGIKGQRWGVRRYQNEDGSLTEAGRERYGKRIYEYTKSKFKDPEITSELRRSDAVRQIAQDIRRDRELTNKAYNSMAKDCKSISSNDQKLSELMDKINKTDYDIGQYITDAIISLDNDPKSIAMSYGIFSEDTYDITQEQIKASSKKNSDIERLARELLGQYGDMTVQKVSGSNISANDILSFELEKIADDRVSVEDGIRGGKYYYEDADFQVSIEDLQDALVKADR